MSQPEPDHGHVSIGATIEADCRFFAPEWQMTIGAITVGIYNPPNIVHRWTQRIFLGITYTRIKP